MKKLLFILTAPLAIQCIAQNTWTQKADFGGIAREGAVSFSIGTKGYIGMGRTNNGIASDFWEYDPAADTWTQKADFGGTGRSYGVGFSIGTKGYVGTGNNDKDFWEYDPAANSWTRKADFGGQARSGATGFSIGMKGYIGTGNAGLFGTIFKKDFWEYDPSINTWTQKADFGGGARFYATGFSIGTKGYIGTGTPDGLEDRNDFWEYDPVTNDWTQKADFGGGARKLATSFSIGTKGYIGMGIDNSNAYEPYDFYEYEPSTNNWTEVAGIVLKGRTGAFGFSIGSKGYIGTGEAFDYLKDVWEYVPASLLPITFSSIKAYEKNRGVQIDWTIQQENNVDRYEVEKSGNGQQFSEIGSIKSKGYSNFATTYNFFDAHPFTGISFYRIKMIDLSSKVNYSQVVKMNISNSGATMITLYPNPVVGNTIILQMNNLPGGNYSIILTNKIGQRVATKIINHPGGPATQTIELSKTLASGVYQLQISGEKTNMMFEVLKE